MATLLQPISGNTTTQIRSGFEARLKDFFTSIKHTQPAVIDLKKIQLSVSSSVLQRLAEIASLRDNWDGYSAVALDKTAIENVRKVFKMLPDYAKTALHFEDIVPSPYGTINLEWSKNNYFVSLEIGNKEIAFFSELPDNTKPFGDNIPFDSAKLPTEFLAALTTLFSPH